jgi:DNA primase
MVINIFNKDTMVEKAKSIRKVLDALGIDEYSKTAEELKCAVALELLGERYKVMKQHSQANFAKSVDKETMQMVMETLAQEGLLSRKGQAALEKK